ncbi:MAG: hypothetical protein Dbin4_00916 [Alphaproteobacteria bacterium]|nr:hypothetical protein [Alphaproteobacteria bacterium]
MTEFELLLQGYRPTTAEILYHIPDHPVLLQSFIWQRLDLAPRFPILCHFLDFWQANLDGKLHSVRVACSERIVSEPIRVAGLVLTLESAPTLH